MRIYPRHFNQGFVFLLLMLFLVGSEVLLSLLSGQPWGLVTLQVLSAPIGAITAWSAIESHNTQRYEL